MIEYKHILGERVALIIVEDPDEPAAVITGIAGLDEDNYIFQIDPDEKDLIEGEGSRFGVGCEIFENDIIRFLSPGDTLRETLDCKYTILLG